MTVRRKARAEMEGHFDNPVPTLSGTGSPRPRMWRVSRRCKYSEKTAEPSF